MGAAFPGKMCVTGYSAGIALVCNDLILFENKYIKKFPSITAYILHILHLYLHLDIAFIFFITVETLKYVVLIELIEF